MCGINGIIAVSEALNKNSAQLIHTMNDTIIHRGPDDSGSFIEHIDNYSIAMGMRRLSIIDLQAGQQPIVSSDKQLVIVFNGEIYNYKSLRATLEKEGATFTTHSDTEVILMGYKFWGVEAFKKLDGMFAFSIYDKTKRKVFIARDFFGEKPLYYTSSESKFIWASELKSIAKVLKTKPPINKTGLNLFFRLTYIPAPYTIYDKVYKLTPNSYLEYDLKSQTYTVKPIHVNKKPDARNKSISFTEAKSQVRELVKDSVESRSVSDVPIGTFLSGGVDSSIVSLCLSRLNSKKINTFSIGFENKSFDETDKSRLVAKQINSDHHEFILNENSLKTSVDAILQNFDEPFADSSALPSYMVAHQTSKFVKVALTGDGGDEVFGGYNKYYMGAINKKYTSAVPEFLHKSILKYGSPLLRTKSDNRGKRYKLLRLLGSVDYSNAYYWDIISLGFPGNSLSEFLHPDYYQPAPFSYYKERIEINNPMTLTDYRNIDRSISLEGDMLVKVDRTSMLTSLESRAPFLNRHLWDYASSLPEDFLLHKWDKKYILKEAFKTDFPEGFLNKSKTGFGVPVGNWLRSTLKADLQGYIDREFLKQQQLFEVEATRRLVTEHLNGKDHTFKVWSFYCFQKWYVTNYS